MGAATRSSRRSLPTPLETIMAAEDKRASERRRSEQGSSIEKAPKNQAQQKRARKQSLVDSGQRRITGGLRPDDIGVVRIEFSVPASRLFGNLSAGGGPVPIVEADNDTDDPVSQWDTDLNDPVLTSNPGPGHFDAKDGS
jgi:hypothetical protein